MEKLDVRMAMDTEKEVGVGCQKKRMEKVAKLTPSSAALPMMLKWVINKVGNDCTYFIEMVDQSKCISPYFYLNVYITMSSFMFL